MLTQNKIPHLLRLRSRRCLGGSDSSRRTMLRRWPSPWRREGIIWWSAHGLANLELAVPAAAGAPLPPRLGEQGCHYRRRRTAGLRGLIELDTPIAYWLPDLPTTTGGRRLRQLFTHTGGVRHYCPRTWTRRARRPVIQRHYPDTPRSSRCSSTTRWLPSRVPGQLFLVRLHARVAGDGGRRRAGLPAADRPRKSLVRSPTKSLRRRSSRDRPRPRSRLFHPARAGLARRAHARPRARTDRRRLANIGLSNPAFCWAGAGLLASMPDLARFGAALLEGP